MHFRKKMHIKALSIWDFDKKKKDDQSEDSSQVTFYNPQNIY